MNDTEILDRLVEMLKDNEAADWCEVDPAEEFGQLLWFIEINREI